jgi:hypothetical protein
MPAILRDLWRQEIESKIKKCLTNPFSAAMIAYIEKGWEEEEYAYYPDRESCPPVERRLKEV